MSDEIFEASDDGSVEEQDTYNGWVDVKTQQPIEDAILDYLTDEKWSKEKHRGEKFDIRQPCQAVMIREGSGNKETLFTWNAKSDGDDLEGAITGFISDHLVDDDAPQKVRLWVHRSPNPDLRDWDSSRTFVACNEPYSEQGDTGAIRLPAPPTLPHRQPMPTGQALQVGGSSFTADYTQMLNQMLSYHERLMETEIARREASLRVDLWVIEFLMNHASKSPNLQLRKLELEHDRDLREKEIATSGRAEMYREVGGVVGGFAGQVAATPAGQRFLEGIMGSTEGREAVVKLMQKFGGDE